MPLPVTLHRSRRFRHAWWRNPPYVRSERLVVDEILEKLSLLICRVGLVGNGRRQNLGGVVGAGRSRRTRRSRDGRRSACRWGSGRERDADPDRFEELLECLSGIGDAGRKAKDFLETARLMLRDDAPPVPRRGEVVAYCVRQAADSILESAGSSLGDGRWQELSRKVVSGEGKVRECEAVRRGHESGAD